MNIILLSGGSGKRLWPLSNDVRSKQFTVLLALEVIVGSVVYVVLNILMKNQLMLEVINMTKQRIHNATKKRI